MSTIHAHGDPKELDLSQIDLNLLLVFDALTRERSVTRAAERMGVTQSAISHQLRRLRELFGDPLLVRGLAGMVLTPRAESLIAPVRAAFTLLGRALAQPDPFDATRSRRAFALATPDVFDMLVLPRLLARMGTHAPGVDLKVLPVNPRALGQQLEAGELDLAVVPRMGPPGDASAGGTPGLCQRTLLRDKSVCLLRKGHPLLRAKPGRARASSPLSLQRYVALPHVLVSPGGEGPGPVDHALAELALSRRIALRLPHFGSALAIVAHSDLVLTAPAALADLGAKHFELVALPAPVKLSVHQVNMTWHERFTEEPGHTWLRGMLSEVTRGIGHPARS
ncbi:MAG: LysR family transcriptional regulator [Myxococcales bacterium]